MTKLKPVPLIWFLCSSENITMLNIISVMKAQFTDLSFEKLFETKVGIK